MLGCVISLSNRKTNHRDKNMNHITHDTNSQEHALTSTNTNPAPVSHSFRANTQHITPIHTPTHMHTYTFVETWAHRYKHTYLKQGKQHKKATHQRVQMCKCVVVRELYVCGFICMYVCVCVRLRGVLPWPGANCS